MSYDRLQSGNLMRHGPKINILGVYVDSLNMVSAVQTIRSWICADEKHYVCVTGVHGIMESQRDPSLKAIHNHAGLVTPDGMPVVWLGRLHGQKAMTRVYGPDLMLAACQQLMPDHARHFLYGGGQGIAEELSKKLRARVPGLEIVGTLTPPFRPLTHEEDNAIVDQIARCAPDIIWVGLSTPKQERWMSEHIERLNAKVLIGVGAAFDFLSGKKPQAPLWMQKNGLEWFYRLMHEPDRLWKRYLVNNPLFVWYLFLQFTRLRNFDLPAHYH